MANYLVMFSAPVEHIQFMHKHPGTVTDYYMGEAPIQDEPVTKQRSFLDKLLGRNKKPPAPVIMKPPVDWPTIEQSDCPDLEINHRNVELYHWILNQSGEPTTGSGSIFQTWFADAPEALPLDENRENFAFMPDMLPALLKLVEAITPESASNAYQAWMLDEKDIEQTSDLETGTAFYNEFQSLAEYLVKTIANKHGLVWVVS